MVENLYLIGYSFGASFGFGIVFRLEKQFLWLAGLSGVVGRIGGTVFQENALGFLQACAGLGIGFAIVSMIMFYYRKFKALKARNDRKISIQ